MKELTIAIIALCVACFTLGALIALIANVLPVINDYKNKKKIEEQRQWQAQHEKSTIGYLQHTDINAVKKFDGKDIRDLTPEERAQFWAVAQGIDNKQKLAYEVGEAYKTLLWLADTWDYLAKHWNDKNDEQEED